MNRISYEGFNNKYATFNTGSGVTAGMPVSLNSDGKCVKVQDDDLLFGICISVRDGIATVQLQGYAELLCDGNYPSFGTAKVVCTSNGGITAVEESYNATYVKVVKIDTDSEIIGFIF